MTDQSNDTNLKLHNYYRHFCNRSAVIIIKLPDLAWQSFQLLPCLTKVSHMTAIVSCMGDLSKSDDMMHSNSDQPLGDITRPMLENGQQAQLGVSRWVVVGSIPGNALCG